MQHVIVRLWNIIDGLIVVFLVSYSSSVWRMRRLNIWSQIVDQILIWVSWQRFLFNQSLQGITIGMILLDRLWRLVNLDLGLRSIISFRGVAYRLYWACSIFRYVRLHSLELRRLLVSKFCEEEQILVWILGRKILTWFRIEWRENRKSCRRWIVSNVRTILQRIMRVKTVNRSVLHLRPNRILKLLLRVISLDMSGNRS